MHKAILAPFVLSILALAGCSGDDGHAAAEDVTCPGGAVLTAAQIEADERHHDEGFDPATLCPVPPAVRLSGLPAAVQVYLKAPFTWEIDPGSVLHGHSMLMSVRYSTASVADADVSLQAYAKEVLKKEHQDLPKTFKGNMTFNVPGTVYVRAYAQVQGEGFPRVDVWSQEIVLNVTPVQPTGVVHTVSHPLGPLGQLDPSELEAALGDALAFDNGDLTDQTLTATSGPPGSAPCELAAPAGEASPDTCLFTVPGSYTFSTDGAQPKSLTVTVAQP